MSCQITPAFSVRRGFLTAQVPWKEFLDAIRLLPNTRNADIAAEVGGALFGGINGMRQLAAEIYIETDEQPLFEKVTFILDFMGTDVLREFLCPIWETEFTLDALDMLDDSLPNIPRHELSKIMQVMKTAPDTLDQLLKEGVIEGVVTARPPGLLATRQNLTEHIWDLLEGPSAKEVLKALFVVFNVMSDTLPIKILYRNCTTL